MIRSPVSCDSHDYRINNRNRSIGNGTGSLNGTNSLRKTPASVSSTSEKCMKTLSHPTSLNTPRIRNRAFYDLPFAPPPTPNRYDHYVESCPPSPTNSIPGIPGLGSSANSKAGAYPTTNQPHQAPPPSPIP